MRFWPALHTYLASGEMNNCKLMMAIMYPFYVFIHTRLVLDRVQIKTYSSNNQHHQGNDDKT